MRIISFAASKKAGRFSAKRGLLTLVIEMGGEVFGWAIGWRIIFLVEIPCYFWFIRRK